MVDESRAGVRKCSGLEQSKPVAPSELSTSPEEAISFDTNFPAHLLRLDLDDQGTIPRRDLVAKNMLKSLTSFNWNLFGTRERSPTNPAYHLLSLSVDWAQSATRSDHRGPKADSRMFPPNPPSGNRELYEGYLEVRTGPSVLPQFGDTLRAKGRRTVGARKDPCGSRYGRKDPCGSRNSLRTTTRTTRFNTNRGHSLPRRTTHPSPHDPKKKGKRSGRPWTFREEGAFTRKGPLR